jgi:hypothetical protein
LKAYCTTCPHLVVELAIAGRRVADGHGAIAVEAVARLGVLCADASQQRETVAQRQRGDGIEPAALHLHLAVEHAGRRGGGLEVVLAQIEEAGLQTEPAVELVAQEDAVGVVALVEREAGPADRRGIALQQDGGDAFFVELASCGAG